MSPLLLAADVLVLALVVSVWVVSKATPRVIALCARFAPADRARLLLRWALAPWLLAWCAVLLPLVPTLMVSQLGLMDWCHWRNGGNASVCPMHGVEAPPTLPMTSLFMLFGLLVLAQVWRVFRAVAMSARVAGRLQQACARQMQIGAQRVNIICSPQPFALSLAWPRPQILVSESVPGALSAEELRALVAHEQAHIERRDGVMRLLLVLSTAVLLPRARAELLAQWDLAVELCCDERAACRTDRLTVAAALLRFQRLVIATAQPAPLMQAFHGSDVAMRVHALLQPPVARPSAPRVSMRMLALAAIPLAFALHEAGEFLLLPLVR